MSGRFRLLDQLGRGGMGTVWRAIDTATGAIVAIKYLHRTLAEDEEYVARFEREAEVIRRIQSNHVVKMLGMGRDDGQPFIAMELVEGQSLRDLLITRGPLGWERTRGLLVQAAIALADAHRVGVIHRDVKPSNLLLSDDGQLKLTDFGIARAADLSRLTGSSAMIGTPAYMAPEGEVDARSDLYSLGCVGYELLTGEPPFPGTTHGQVIAAHTRRQPDLSRLPRESRDVIGWLLQKDPALRPPNAEALVAVLRGQRRPPRSRLRAHPVVRKNRRRRQVMLARNAGIASFGLLCAIAVTLLTVQVIRELAGESGNEHRTVAEQPPAIVPSAVPPATRVLAAGSEGTCAIGAEGRLICWGDVAHPIPGGTYSSVALGRGFACALDEHGRVVCWGENKSGQSSAPRGQRFTAVTAATNYACGLTENATLHCWGDAPPFATLESVRAVSAGDGGLCAVRLSGVLTCHGRESFLALAPPGVFTTVAVGHHHACAVRDDAAMVCWGANGAGQLAAPPDPHTQAAVGLDFSCALRGDGTVACWGNAAVVGEAPLGTFEALVAGSSHACARREAGEIVCWGARDQAIQPPASQVFTSITAGGDFACGITPESRLLCWGRNALGQAVSPEGTFAAVAAGERHACTLTSTGEVYCQGANDRGQATAPQGTFTAVFAASDTTCAARAAGGLVCWGASAGSTLPLTRFDGLSGDARHGCARRVDGSLSCFRLSEGFLQSVIDDPGCRIEQAPGPIRCGNAGPLALRRPPDGAFVALARNLNVACAIRDDARVVCWGAPLGGEASPPDGAFREVSVGTHLSCGIRIDGQATCWGMRVDRRQTAPPREVRAKD